MIAYLSVGSNLGDRLELLRQAVRKLEASHTNVTQISSVYETLPQGKIDQPNFLNIALKVETTLDPPALLKHIQTVETALGRMRVERWGPRTVDIDIVLFDDLAVTTTELTIPHPRAAERAFVLIPLLELNPMLPFRQTLDTLPNQGVQLFLVAPSFVRHVNGIQ